MVGLCQRLTWIRKKKRWSNVNRFIASLGAAVIFNPTLNQISSETFWVALKPELLLTWDVCFLTCCATLSSPSGVQAVSGEVWQKHSSSHHWLTHRCLASMTEWVVYSSSWALQGFINWAVSLCPRPQADKKDPQGTTHVTGFEVLLQKQLKGKQLQKEMAEFIHER